MSWKIEYYDGTTWKEIKGRVEHILQEFNGHEEAIIQIANNAENLSIVNQDRDVRISYNQKEIFKGVLSGVDYYQNYLRAKIYNKCFEIMKRRISTRTYSSTMASKILQDICSDAGVTAGPMYIDKEVSPRFNRAYCFDCAVFLADILNTDYWSRDTTFYVRPRNACIGYYPLDGNRNDYSGFFINLGLVGNEYWVLGKFKYAARFDGSSCFRRLFGPDLPSSAITISHWIKPLSTPSYFQHSIGLGGHHSATVYLYPNSYQVYYKFNNIGGSLKEKYIGTIDANWHHVVVTYDGSYIRGYIDGVLKTIEAASGPINYDDTSIYIGNTGFGSAPGDNWFIGDIDEVLIYERALTPLEVKEMYSSVNVSVSRRSIDRSKIRDKVIVRGVDAEGNEIFGEAGTGDRIAVFQEKRASTVADLTDIAKRKLAELKKETSGASITIPISIGYQLLPGDTYFIHKPELNISGGYRITKIIKHYNKCVIELDKQESILEKMVESTRNYENLGIYYVPGTQVPQSIALSPHSPLETLLHNGFFEIDRNGDGIPDYWTTAVNEGSPSFGRVNTQQTRGGYSVYVACSGAGHKGEWVSDFIAVSPGKKYYVCMDVLGSVSGNASDTLGRIGWFDQNKQNPIYDNFGGTDVPTSWATRSAEKTCPSGKYYARVYLRNCDFNGTIYFDNVIFSELRTKVPEAQIVTGQMLGYGSGTISQLDVWYNIAALQISSSAHHDVAVILTSIKLGPEGGDYTYGRFFLRLWNSYDNEYYPNADGVPFFVQGNCNELIPITVPKDLAGKQIIPQLLKDWGYVPQSYVSNVTFYGHSPHVHR